MLSPCVRQVTHALLTRPPLGPQDSIRKLPPGSPVRLACVKHAASVHPEPGSNSHVQWLFSPCQNNLAILTVSLMFSHPTFTVLGWSSQTLFFLNLLFESFLEFFLDYSLRIFRVALLFICQGALQYILLLCKFFTAMQWFFTAMQCSVLLCQSLFENNRFQCRRLKNTTDVRLSYNIRKVFLCQLLF